MAAAASDAQGQQAEPSQAARRGLLDPGGGLKTGGKNARKNGSAPADAAKRDGRQSVLFRTETAELSNAVSDSVERFELSLQVDGTYAP